MVTSDVVAAASGRRPLLGKAALTERRYSENCHYNLQSSVGQSEAQDVRP